MTGAEHFSAMVSRLEFVALEVPEHMRSNVLCHWISEGTVALADRLLDEHDYGGAHDVVRMGAEMMRQFAIIHLRELDDDGKRVAAVILQRIAVADVRIDQGPANDPDVSAAIDANALSDEELRMLGIE